MNRINQTKILVLFAAIAISLTGCCKEVEEKLAQKTAELGSCAAREKNCNESLDQMSTAASAMAVELKAAEAAKMAMAEQAKNAQERLGTVREILQKLKIIIDEGDLKVRINRGKMVLELPSAILFASGKADLSDKGKETLTTVAGVLKDIKDREFQVSGHTDNVKVSENNPFGDNWHLSAARGVSVVMYLVEAGINPRSLSAAGYAQFAPTANNSSNKGRTRNRRIEITLMPNLQELPDLTDIEKEFNLVEPPEPQ